MQRLEVFYREIEEIMRVVCIFDVSKGYLKCVS